MKTNLRALCASILFVVFLGGFFLANRIIKPPELSLSERRALKTMPELSVKSLFGGGFSDDFEEYAADSFAFREELRTVRAFSALRIFNLSDKGGIYFKNGQIGRFESMKAASARRLGQKINHLAANMQGLNIYYSIIPDKGVYVDSSLPGLRQDEAAALLGEELGRYSYIDLTEALEADDFYRADLHWDQIKIAPVVAALAKNMGCIDLLNQAYTPHSMGTFKGAYAGQLALPVKPDTLSYFTNQAIDNAKVKYYSTKTMKFEAGEMYSQSGFKGYDPYDFFLKGSQPLIVIENDKASTEKELYLFRDSFGSSLAPLLTSAYSKITLIDLRYVDSRILPQLVEFKSGSDVLFIYSSQILNSSDTLLAQ
ncbi:MAG: hypothetical protein LBS74_10405 [Oscillospiraceae bacterium]|jgi:hypothetical protein|nr:hypothetical protein [Oscillospiraceae bacterium]